MYIKCICCRVVRENGLASERNTGAIIGVYSYCNARGVHAIKLLEWHAMGYRETSVVALTSFQNVMAGSKTKVKHNGGINSPLIPT